MEKLYRNPLFISSVFYSNVLQFNVSKIYKTRKPGESLEKTQSLHGATRFAPKLSSELGWADFVPPPPPYLYEGLLFSKGMHIA